MEESPGRLAGQPCVLGLAGDDARLCSVCACGSGVCVRAHIQMLLERVCISCARDVRTHMPVHVCIRVCARE